MAEILKANIKSVSNGYILNIEIEVLRKVGKDSLPEYREFELVFITIEEVLAYLKNTVEK